jgi:hypothetical protein
MNRRVGRICFFLCRELWICFSPRPPLRNFRWSRSPIDDIHAAYKSGQRSHTHQHRRGIYLDRIPRI